MDELIQEKVTQKENELNATYDEKIRNYEERCATIILTVQVQVQNAYGVFLNREQDLQRQVSLTKGQLRDLRMSNDSNQAKLLDHTQRQGMLHGLFASEFLSYYRCDINSHILRSLDQEVVEKLAELDMMVADLERANSRVVTVERRNVSRLDFIGMIETPLTLPSQELLRAEIEAIKSGNESSDR